MSLMSRSLRANYSVAATGLMPEAQALLASLTAAGPEGLAGLEASSQLGDLLGMLGGSRRHAALARHLESVRHDPARLHTDLKGVLEGTLVLRRPKPDVGTVAQLAPDPDLRGDAERVLKRIIALSRGGDAIPMARIERSLEMIEDAARREVLRPVVLELLGGFHADLGLPPPENPRTEERRILKAQLDPLAALARRLDDLTPTVNFAAECQTLTSRIDEAPALELSSVRHALAALQLRVRQTLDQVLREESLRLRQSMVPDAGYEFLACTDRSMAAFLSGLGFSPKDPQFPEVVGVVGATVFGWGERTLPADLGILSNALTFINEDLGLQSRVARKDRVAQVDPIDFMELALHERGQAFFDLMDRRLFEITIRYPASWGEFSYGELGLSLALSRMRASLGATDTELSEALDELIAEGTISEHRRGKVRSPQQMWERTRSAFAKLFSVSGDQDQSRGEALLFFLTYRPFIDRWIRVDDGTVQVNDVAPGLSAWKIHLIPEGGAPSIGIDIGLRCLFSRAPLSYLLDGRMEQAVHMSRRRLVLARALGNGDASTLLSEAERLEGRLAGARQRMAAFQSDPASRRPGDVKKTAVLCEETVRLAQEAASLEISLEGTWNGTPLMVHVASSLDLANASRRVWEESGRYHVVVDCDREAEAVLREPEQAPLLANLLMYRAVHLLLSERQLLRPASSGSIVDGVFPGGLRGEAWRATREFMAALPPSLESSWMPTREDPWVRKVLDSSRGPALSHTPRPLAGNLEDRLEAFARKRHAATDEEVALLRDVFRAHMSGEGGAFRHPDQTLIERLIREQTRTRKSSASYWRVRTILMEFLRLMEGGTPPVADIVVPAEIQPRTASPRGVANIALGRYITLYREILPNLDPEIPYVLVPDWASHLMADAMASLGVAHATEDVFAEFERQLGVLNQNRKKTMALAEDPVIRPVSGELLGDLSDEAPADALLQRIGAASLREGGLAEISLVRELEKLKEDWELLTGAASQGVDWDHARDRVSALWPVIERRLGSARRLWEREADPQEREVLRRVLQTSLFGWENRRLVPIVEDVVRETYAIEILPAAIYLKTAEVSRILQVWAGEAFQEASEMEDFLGFVGGEMEEGNLALEASRTVPEHLGGWAREFLTEDPGKRSWSERTDDLFFKLALAGRSDAALDIRTRLQTLEAALEKRLHPPAETPPPTADAPAAIVTRPERPLPAPQWDVASYRYFTPEEHRDFWDRVAEAGALEGEGNLVYFLTDEGPRMIRVTLANAERLMRIRRREEDAGVVAIRDEASGETVSFLPVQFRLMTRAHPSIVRFARWLATLSPEDPQYADARLIDACALFLPIADTAKQDFYHILSLATEVLEGADLREHLNRFARKHAVSLERYRHYHAHMGPWYLSTDTSLLLRAHLEGDGGTRSRIEKILDLLETDAEIPSTTVTAIRDAIRAIESVPRPGDDDARRLLEALLPHWPVAREGDEKRLRGLIPAEGTLPKLAEAPELVAIYSLLLMSFHKRLQESYESLRNADPQTAEETLAFYRNLLRSMNVPQLEPLHRVLYILFIQGVLNNPLMVELNRLFRKYSNDLLGSNEARQRKALAKLLYFYQDHRDELLWRLKGVSDHPHLNWVSSILPDPMPPKHALSAEFPELEALTYSMVDDYQKFVRAFAERGRDFQDTILVKIEEDGIRRMVIVRPEDILKEPMGPGQTWVPVGLRSAGGEVLYWHHLLARNPQWSGALELLPDGADEIALIDALGEVRVIRRGDIGEIQPVHEVLTTEQRNRMIRFEAVILSSDALRDLHPLVVMMLASCITGTPADRSSFAQLASLAATYARQPQKVVEHAIPLRRKLLEIYRLWRRTVGPMVDKSIRKYFDINRPPQ